MADNNESIIPQSVIIGFFLIIFIWALIKPSLIETRDMFIDFGNSVRIIYSMLKSDFIEAYNSILVLFPIAIRSWKFYLTLFIIFSPLIIYLNYKFNYMFIKWKENRARRIREKNAVEKSLLREKEEIIDILNNSIKEYSSNELKELRGRLLRLENRKQFIDIKDRVSKRIKDIEFRLPIVRKEEKLWQLKLKEENARERINQLDEIAKKKEIALREFEETSLRKLNAHKNRIFLEDDLAEKEKQLLMKYGYKRAYEYCVYERRNIHVLVKPAMKHSVTHTFLVWSVMRAVKEMNGVYNVFSKDTREADVTFSYNKIHFALEIETGTLLKKKVQLREKIEYLNSRFKNRWMIIVSKKSLMPKYGKLGKVACRSEVQKKVKNMLKFA